MYDPAKLQGFTHLVGNNDQPSDKVLIALKNALAEPYRQLADIDAQIRLLEDRVRELRQNRVKIEQSVAPYRGILSPMRRIPSDILFTIFRHCLPTHRNPTMAAKEAPMLLTRVCSRWRTIALASPRLWARIHIPYQIAKACNFVQGSGYADMSLEAMSLFLQTRCKAIHEWLLRSHDCLLSISIYYVNRYDLDRPEHCKSTFLLLETIFLHASRWKSLELNVPLEVYAKLEWMVSNSRMALSNLVQVRLAVDPSHHYVPPDSGAIGILKSPSLKRISLSLMYERSFLNIFDVKSLPWSNITHFSNHTCIDIDGVFIILKHCSRLIHASFTLLNARDIDIEETIHLPSLASLFITATSQFSSAIDKLYGSMCAPAIRWIRLRDTMSQGPIRLSHHEGPSILPLVEHSVAGIRVLELDRFHFRPDVLRRMMQVPSTTFFLHTLYLRCTNPRYTNAMILAADLVEPLDLNDLIVQKSVESNEVLALLPRLENFELQSTKVSDETVLDFITSRIDPTLPVCVLKKVTIVFNRPQDISKPDLKEEVCRRAAVAGVEIDLAIRYLDVAAVNQDYINPLSPSVVGNDLRKDGIADCRSWLFEDLTQEFAVEDDDL